MKKEIIEEVKNIYEGEIIVREVTKNNGVTLTGVTPVLGDGVPCPTVYVDEYAVKVERGEITVEEAAEKIVNVIESANNDFALDIDNFEELTIIPEVVNAKTNDLTGRIYEILSETEDLAVNYRILIEAGENGMGTILITEKFAKRWGVTLNEIKEKADQYVAENATVSGILEALMEIVGGDKSAFEKATGDSYEVVAAKPDTMIVVSNKAKAKGAGSITSVEVLRKACERLGGTKMVILPSSVHEVICIPYVEGNEEMLTSMVNEINSTQVIPEEVLSGNVYIFDAETGVLRINK